MTHVSRQGPLSPPVDGGGTRTARTGPLRQARWNPYVVGALIGVLSWVTFALMGKALGTSTSFSTTAGLATAVAAPEHVAANSYYAKLLAPNGNFFDWQLALVLMLPIGALLGRKLSARPEERQFVEHVPPLWRQRFGDSRLLRYTAAFVGGAVMLFGARMAGGCTSGHGLSGGLQLAVSSWSFLLAMFASGVLTAFALFGKDGRRHV